MTGTSNIRIKRCLLSVAAILAVTPFFSASAQGFDTARPEVSGFIDKLVSEHGFDAAYVSEVLSGSSSRQSILDAMSRPAEKTLAWHEYRAIFLTDKRIDAGVEFWSEHGDDLARIATDTGVPIEMLIGIIGVETFFGRITGSYPVVDALATLAFDYPPRSRFFTRELEELFLLGRDESFDLSTLKGSYAGAMGAPQFIPSSYRAYAVDGDGDGVRDLFASWDDVVASVANYFVVHGWRPGEDVVEMAQLKDGVNGRSATRGLKPDATVASLSDAGIMFATGLDSSAPAGLVALEGDDGEELWVSFHNFYVITRYNRSVMYALAAWQLGQAVGARNRVSVSVGTDTQNDEPAG